MRYDGHTWGMPAAGGILNYNFMGKGQVTAPGFEAEELRGFSRTVAEIEWLLVILVMLYQVVQGRSEDAHAQIYVGLIVYSAFVLGFRYFNVHRTDSRWKPRPTFRSVNM